MTVLCRDAFAGHPDSIVGNAGGASCDVPVDGTGWMCAEHSAMADGLLALPIADLPDDSPRPKAEPEPDPEAKARRDEARSFLAGYSGASSFLLDLKADRRYGTSGFRVTDRMADAILRVKAAEAEATASPAREREAEVLEWIARSEGSSEFAASLAAGVRRFGRPTDKQHAAVLRILEREPSGSEPEARKVAAEPGWYRVGEDVYKVQLARSSGRPYAKRLVVRGQGEASWEYEGGAVYRLTDADRLSLEDAAAFGKRYGTCCVCGRTLTDPESIAAGIGPVCSGRLARREA